MKIGILAIQGDYEAHAKVLDRLGVEHIFVRSPQDLAAAMGLPASFCRAAKAPRI